MPFGDSSNKPATTLKSQEGEYTPFPIIRKSYFRFLY